MFCPLSCMIISHYACGYALLLQLGEAQIIAPDYPHLPRLLLVNRQDSNRALNINAFSFVGDRIYLHGTVGSFLTLRVARK